MNTFLLTKETQYIYFSDSLFIFFQAEGLQGELSPEQSGRGAPAVENEGTPPPFRPGTYSGELEAVKTVEEVREEIVKKASENEAFRAELVADPKVAIEKELGVTIPEGFKIGVHEDNIMSINLVLPPAELSEEELSAVVAGAQMWQEFANAWNSLNQNS